MRWLPHTFRATPTIMLVVASALLVACGSDGADGKQPSARDKHVEAQAAKKRAAKKPANPDADMVAAPSTAKTPGAVALKFAVASKPEIGAPVDIHLALVPTEGLERVIASFQASEGLELRSGAKTPMYEKPAAGTSINHTLTVVPNTNGILYITAVILSDSETASVSRTFMIPLIAGEGLSASSATAKSTATPSMASAPAAKSRQSE